MLLTRLPIIAFGLAPFLALPATAMATNTVANPICPSETAFFAPGQAKISLPAGFNVRYSPRA